MGRTVIVGIAFCAITGCGSLDKGLPTWSSNLAQSHKGKRSIGEKDTAPATLDPQTVDIPIARPTQEHPVTLGAAVSRPRVKAGEPLMLVVRCQTASPWHIYAADGSADSGVPTKVNLQLPPGIMQPSPMQLPVAATHDSPLGKISTYSGDFRFMIPLQAMEGATAGTRELQCEIVYQACSDSTCLAPDSQRMVIPLTVQSPQ